MAKGLPSEMRTSGHATEANRKKGLVMIRERARVLAEGRRPEIMQVSVATHTPEGLRPPKQE